MTTLPEIKAALVQAHRSKDWAEASRLSQAKETFKKRQTVGCEVCGVTIHRSATRCMAHAKHRLSERAKRMIPEMAVLLAFTCLGASIMPPAPMPAAAPAIHIKTNTVASVSLAWNRNTNAAVTGYNLYYGRASKVYTNMVGAGASTNLTVSNLLIGATYYFAATDFDSVGLESPYSAELSYTIPVPPAKPATNVVTVTGTNLFSGATIHGPWTRLTPTNGTSFSFTNPTGSQFFRGTTRPSIKRTTI